MLKTKIKKNNTKLFSSKLIEIIESKHINKNSLFNIKIGDIVKIGYLIPEGDKERTQYYEGLIIAKQNKGLGKSFTLRRMVQGIGIEQIFLLHSPKLISVTCKQVSKIRRSKLYYLRFLRGKATRLKAKI